MSSILLLIVLTANIIFEEHKTDKKEISHRKKSQLIYCIFTKSSQELARPDQQNVDNKDEKLIELENFFMQED